MTKKFYDCSVNELSDLLHNKSSLGPIENDIMFDLGKYANYYGWERVYDYKKADLIITNGFYTSDILEWTRKYSIPKVKRMDGIYFLYKYISKNELLNSAAKQSDYVIFISQYSYDSLLNLYNFTPDNYSVILNNVDDTIFYPGNKVNENFTMVTSATNWIREEKRLSDLIELSKLLDKGDIIKLIGQCDIDLSKNIIKIGYVEDKNKMNEIINSSDVFLSLFYKDAGSKVTCQSAQCNVPILYSNTGGLPEIVKNNGIEINDNKEIKFVDNIPTLNIDELYNKYKLIKNIYKDIKHNYVKSEKYKDTLSKYFDVFRLFV